jgi:hypothetical protein
MPDKKLLQDIIPVKINKIHSPMLPVSSPSLKKSSDRAAFHHFQKPKKQKRRRTPNPQRRKIWLIVLLATACIVIIFLAITYVYAKAVVIITPKSEQVAVNATYTAVKNGSAGAVSASTAGPLSYEVIKTSETASTTVLASQGPLIENKAWGLIILYNAYSTTAQKLLVGTRLTNDKGLIYKTAETVTIPGIHKTPTAGNPSATSTGSVSVYIVADQAGAQYNIAPTDLTGDFRIVAFQGEPKYADIYGRLKPKGAIIGGYSGSQEVVATSTLTSATASLTQSVSSALKSDLKALVPDGYVLYDGAYGIQMASTTISQISSTTVVALKGTLLGIMFKENDLVKAIAPAQVAEFPPTNFVINNLSSLKFNPTDPAAFQNILNSQNQGNGQGNEQSNGTISFTLSGSFGLVGTFPTDGVAKALAGLSVAQSKDVFAKYSTIMSAHAIITPFWKHSFPDSSNKIIIDIQQ